MTALRSLPMSLMVGLVHRDGGRRVASRLLDGLAERTSGGTGTRVTRSGLALAAAGETTRVEESATGWLLADLDLTNMDELAEAAGRPAGAPDLFLTLWQREGAAFLGRLRGGFAIALGDAASRQVLLAADRFGFRRLYHALHADTLAFGSRVEAALAGGAPRAVDPEAVYAYLNFATVPAPQTIYRGVRRLPPGHLLLWKDGQLTEKPYWDVVYREQRVTAGPAAMRMVRQTEEAVRASLAGLSLKETGAFLSGGTDSSTVVGLMTRISGERANAFSISFAEARYDELSYAELAARHFGAAHYVKQVSAEDALGCLPDILSAYDEPFGNTSVVPTYLCLRLARETGMRVLLAGDGGDEIFGGNERYRREQVLGRYRWLPLPVRRGLVEPLLHRVPPGRMDLVGKAQRYVERASVPNPARFYSTEFFVAQERRRLLAPDFLAAVPADGPLQVAERHYRAAQAGAEMHRLMYIDLKITLGDNDLFKVTRAAEAAGVAVRFPMLDHPLVEMTASLPAWCKVRGTEKRHLFKRAFAELLPPAILAKRKHGFGVPISDWLRTHRGFRELLRDTLGAQAARERGYFAPGAVDALCARHEADSTPFYGGVLWTMLMLELWHRHHGDRG